jgi:hypothetical protein
MHMARTIAAWVGTFMTTLAVVLAQQYWYGSSISHTPVVFWSMIACPVIAGACFIFWFLTSHGKPLLEKVQTTYGANSSVGGSGNSMTAGRDNKQIKAKNYYEAAPAAPPPPPQEQPEVGKTKLDFDVKAEWVSLVYENAPGRWRKSIPSDPSPRRSFIVHFTRNEPPKGGKTTTAISLVSILKFTYSTGSEKVSRAYWLGRNNYQIDFEAGHQEAVVVGSCEGPLFSSYLNKFASDGSNEYFASPVRGLGDRKVMHTAGPILVRISLFDVYANTTVEVKEFEISIAGSTASAKEVK